MAALSVRVVRAGARAAWSAGHPGPSQRFYEAAFGTAPPDRRPVQPSGGPQPRGHGGVIEPPRRRSWWLDRTSLYRALKPLVRRLAPPDPRPGRARQAKRIATLTEEAGAGLHGRTRSSIWERTQHQFRPATLWPSGRAALSNTGASPGRPRGADPRERLSAGTVAASRRRRRLARAGVRLSVNPDVVPPRVSHDAYASQRKGARP